MCPALKLYNPNLQKKKQEKNLNRKKKNLRKMNNIFWVFQFCLADYAREGDLIESVKL